MQEIEINVETLERLRSRFLENATNSGVYWQSEEDLALYHKTFAARIGWKWDNALESATQAGFSPKSRQILDWGCGSGIATLRFVEQFGADAFDTVLLWDHSTLACRYAEKRIKDAFPSLNVEIAGSPQVPSGGETLVLVSHALNELGFEAQQALTSHLRNAVQILLVEPGTHSSSRKLIALREALLEDFHILAPCTHCEMCPMLSAENGQHWCHLFGKPPVEAFTESFWSAFSQAMEIDLRSLPYSFLVLENKRVTGTPTESDKSQSRLIGRPRQFKGYTRLLSCDQAGLRELELQKRDDKQLWKILKKNPTNTLFRWLDIEMSTARLKSGEQL